MTTFLLFSDLGDLGPAIATADVQAPHIGVLFRAERDGVLTVAKASREAPAPLPQLERTGRPVLILVGDDDYQSTGPDGWASARQLRYWARGAMVHGSGAERQHYETAVGMALAVRRFLLIETSSAHARTWGEWLLAGSPPVLFVGVLPRDGGAHPVIPARESMQ